VYTPCWRMGGRDIPPLILNLGTRWWWEVSFVPQPSYPGGKLTIGWETGWTWNPSGCLERSKNAASAGSQTQTVGSFIPWRRHSIDWDISGLLQTVFVTGGGRATRANECWVHDSCCGQMPAFIWTRDTESTTLCMFRLSNQWNFISVIGVE